jgi:hypothetical protein
MIALGLVFGAAEVASAACAMNGHPSSHHQWWAKRKDNVKNRQNRQCLFCGRGEGRWGLEIHHVKRQAHGGTDALYNLVCACHACHRLIHNAERRMPFAGRLILALQVLSPESIFVTLVCRAMFRAFLMSPAASLFHPAALRLRPPRATNDGPDPLAMRGASPGIMRPACALPTIGDGC